MSLLDKVKHALITEDPVPVSPTVQSVRPIAQPVMSAWMPPSATAVTSPVDDGELSALRSRVHPKSGPLVVFSATLKSLASYIPDESSRYHAAQEAMQAQGFSVTDVLSEITAATGRVDTEMQTFDAQKQAKMAKEVTSREDEIRTIAQQVTSHEAAIQALNAQRDTLAAALTEEKSKIATKAEQISGAVAALKNEYNDAAEKLRRYLMIGGAQS